MAREKRRTDLGTRSSTGDIQRRPPGRQSRVARAESSSVQPVREAYGDPTQMIAAGAPYAATCNIQAMADHELTLYFTAAPLGGLNWKSPRSLLVSTAKTYGAGAMLRKRHPIGHVNVELSGVRENGERIDIFMSGMTSVDEPSQTGGEQSQATQVLKGGYGLGVLYTDVPGMLEAANVVAPEVAERAQSERRMSYITFKLTPEQAQRLYDYMVAYDQGVKDYGLENRPLYGEGAGCSAFGASFLQQLDLDLPEFREGWTRHFDIAERLIGDPENGQRVSPLDIALHGGRWHKPGEPTRAIDFWEPDRMHEWTTHAHKRAERGEDILPGWEVTTEKRGKAKGLVIDARKQPVPERPLFRAETEASPD